MIKKSLLIVALLGFLFIGIGPDKHTITPNDLMYSKHTITPLSPTTLSFQSEYL